MPSNLFLAHPASWAPSRLAPLQEATTLDEGLLTLRASGEAGLGLHHPIHLVLALRAARVEGLLHPVALRLQVLAVLLLLGLHRRLRAVLLSRLGDLLVQVRLLLLKGDLLGIQRLQALECRCALLLELLLRGSLASLRGLDLVLEVLLDVPHDRDDATALARAPPVRSGEGLRSLVWIDGVLRRLALLLNKAQGQLVVLVERGHGVDGRREERNCIDVVLERRLEVLILAVSVGKCLGHRVLGGLDVALGLLDVILGLLLLSIQALNVARNGLHLVLQILNLGLNLVLLSLAIVAESDVVHLLLPELREHLVHGRDDYVKVARCSGLHHRCHRRHAEAVVLARKRLQDMECCLLSVVLRHAALLGLEEHAGGAAERGGGLVAGEDFDGLVDTRELLGPEPRSLGPLVGLRLAGGLGLLEERLIVGELCLRLVALDRGVRHGLCVFAESLLLLLKSRLQRGKLGALRGGELLVLFLLHGLVRVLRLQVRGKRIVHALEDALDGPRGGRVVAKRTLLLDAAELRVLPIELRRVADKGLDQLPVVLRHRAERVARGHKAERTTDTTRNAQDLRLLQGTRCLLASTRQDADGPLEGADRLLEVRALLLVVCGLLLADRGRFVGAVDVCRDVLLELRNLCLQGRRLALEVQDLRAQLLDARLRLLDGARLPRGGLLAPASKLVVDLLLGLAVCLDLGLHLLYELDHLCHWCVGAWDCREGCAQNEDRARAHRCSRRGSSQADEWIGGQGVLTVGQ